VILPQYYSGSTGRRGCLSNTRASSREWIAQRHLGRDGFERHDGAVAAVTRLVTFVDVEDDVADPRQMSVSARHEAVLVNGRCVLLLDDRGWSASGPPNIWAITSVEDIVDTARMIVGPDEPFGGRSQQEMEADHWAPVG
jgi:hypothetical protein